MTIAGAAYAFVVRFARGVGEYSPVRTGGLELGFCNRADQAFYEFRIRRPSVPFVGEFEFFGVSLREASGV
jgi:hypothetical protein